jgi:pimeloyl-ACP methyl ester carboxylesterase
MNFTSQKLSTITARTLVVHGDRDNFFPIAIPKTIHHSIPNSDLWIIPGGDHVPIYDSTIPFTETAIEFLNKTKRK